MTSAWSNEFSISLAESATFARLSGDYNPMHIDATAARRTRFGGTVVHGIHLYLRALDAIASKGLLAGYIPFALSAMFDNAVLTGATVRLQVESDGTKVRLKAESDDGRCFSGALELRRNAIQPTPLADAEFYPENPQDINFSPSPSGGIAGLRLSAAILYELFPCLAQLENKCWIADLLATTQIVGMRCPGMHSIYSSFKLRHAERDATGSMQYSVIGTAERLQLIRMQVAGACLSGTVEAFFRPRPVTQARAKDVAHLVPSRAFAGHKVLVVGGSRGLGELTAKIVAAGGADVTITYAHGKRDAEKICAELRTMGHECCAQQIDIQADGSMPNVSEWLTRTRYSHLYFFASPLIAKNTGSWNDTLFRRFTQVYVAAFSELIRIMTTERRDNNTPLKILYPSSIFVGHPEPGFAEYSVAKAAGEALCDQLQSRYDVLISKPRLPRMRTDQTSASAAADVEDPVPTMMKVIREFQC